MPVIRGILESATVSHDRDENAPDEPDHGVLNATQSIDVSGVGFVDGATAQIDIVLPTRHDDDDLDDDVMLDDVAPQGAEAEHADVLDAEPEDAVIEETQAEDVAVNETTTPDDQPPAPAGDVVAEESDAALDDAIAGDAPAPEAAPVAIAAGKGAPTPQAEPGTTAIQVVSPRGPQPSARVRPRTSEIALQSRRLGDFEANRESPELLTSDRLLDPAHVVRRDPEGTWQHLVYTLSGRRINLGDGKRARARHELDRRISAPLTGGARFVPVLSRKGGVGKTTITTLLGMALADARDDRIIAVDANPDRGTLADRVGRASGKTVRDLVNTRADIHGFNDISQIVARDETRLDILASDADPHVSEAFSDEDYQQVADIAAHFYSIVLTDTGTGIVHSVMEATLERADDIVIVAGLSIDEARLASETLTWLETNGFADQARRAIVVLNTSRPGAALVRASELEAHFQSRVRAVVRMPYDPHIASGSTMSFRELQAETRKAARDLAATVVEGLRVPVAG